MTFSVWSKIGESMTICKWITLLTRFFLFNESVKRSESLRDFSLAQPRAAIGRLEHLLIFYFTPWGTERARKCFEYFQKHRCFPAMKNLIKLNTCQCTWRSTLKVNTLVWLSLCFKPIGVPGTNMNLVICVRVGYRLHQSIVGLLLCGTITVYHGRPTSSTP